MVVVAREIHFTFVCWVNVVVGWVVGCLWLTTSQMIVSCGIHAISFVAEYWSGGGGGLEWLLFWYVSLSKDWLNWCYPSKNWSHLPCNYRAGLHWIMTLPCVWILASHHYYKMFLICRVYLVVVRSLYVFVIFCDSFADQSWKYGKWLSE